MTACSGRSRINDPSDNQSLPRLGRRLEIFKCRSADSRSFVFPLDDTLWLSLLLDGHALAFCTFPTTTSRMAIAGLQNIRTKSQKDHREVRRPSPRFETARAKLERMLFPARTLIFCHTADS
jgi:hypothetical protein